MGNLKARRGATQPGNSLTSAALRAPSNGRVLPGRLRFEHGRASAAGDVLRRRMLAVADVIGLLSSAVLVGLTAPEISGVFGVAVLAPAWVLLAKLHGLYDRDHRSIRHLTVDELSTLASWATMGTALSAVLVSLTPAGGLSTPTAVRLWVGVVVLVPLTRSAARAVWRRITPPERAVLIGAGPLERATTRKVTLFRDVHMEVAGRLDDGDVRRLAAGETVERLLVEKLGNRLPERLVLVSQEVNEQLLAELVGFCKARRVKLSVVPPARGMFGTAVRLTHVAELPFIEYNTWDASRSTLLLKRLLDVIVASLLLVLLSPLLALVALLIRLSSRGPVLFTQLRSGQGGREFRMAKFRTMVVDAEQQLHTLVAVDQLSTPMFKLRRDPRVTPVGRFLRRWSIDELPQLYNVVRGDMSLVGPRPEQIELVHRYRPEHRFRLAAKPGLTGPMQVFGRGELEFEERLAVEREYIENMSLSRDLRILVLTIPVLLSGRGAF